MTHVEGHGVKGSCEHRHDSEEAAMCLWTASVHHRYRVRWRRCDWSSRERTLSGERQETWPVREPQGDKHRWSSSWTLICQSIRQPPSTIVHSGRRHRRRPPVTDDQPWHPVTSDLLVFCWWFRFGCYRLRRCPMFYWMVEKCRNMRYVKIKLKHGQSTPSSTVSASGKESVTYRTESETITFIKLQILW